MLQHVYQTFKPLMQNSIQLWVDRFEAFAVAVRSKSGAPAHFADIICFVDGTIRPISRPTFRADEADPDVRNIQEEVYSGHKRVHCLKWQGVVMPNGIISDLNGPFSGRRHDSYLMTESQLNGRLANAQAGNASQYKAFGDKAYAILSHVSRGWQGVGLTARQQADNKHMSACRIAIEWAFGNVLNLWAFVDYKKNQKLFQQPVAKLYLCAALLTNFHTCLYGSQVAEHFNVSPPTLEEYSSMLDAVP
jgi:hypothetical protein